MVALIEKEHSKSELANTLGHKAISGTLNQRIRQMLHDEIIEYTIPEKPTSRLQKYRLTEKGRALLKDMEEKHKDD